MRPPSQPDQPTSADRLRAATRRLARALRAEISAPRPDDPQPATEWGQRAEERLRAVEQQLANQNRLLLFSFVAIIADVIAKVVTR
jgi:hypothetical protein